MQKLITIEKFTKIFQKMEYRKKLDQILLNFFGLTNSYALKSEQTQTCDITIEIILMINTEKILSILVIDTKKILKESKKFYINLSYRQVESYYTLLIPCFWEIYIPFSKEHLKNKPQILLIAALLFCTTEKEIIQILKRIGLFSKEEIQDILSLVKK